MLRSDLHAERSSDVLQEGLRAASEELWFVNPTRDTMADLVHVLRETGSATPPTPIRIFAAERPLKALSDDFLLASVTADLVSTEQVKLRSLETPPRHSLLMTPDSVVSLIECERRVAGLTSARDEFVEQAYAEYQRRWRRAEAFTLRTPPLSEIRESLADDIGPETATDFDRALEALTDVDGERIDEVTLSLLVAANNGELLYDISRWGEDIRLASKATFSRNKNQLEDIDLIETEKVPIDVGRPRLRLVLGDAVRGDDIKDVTKRAQRELGG